MNKERLLARGRDVDYPPPPPPPVASNCRSSPRQVSPSVPRRDHPSAACQTELIHFSSRSTFTRVL